MCLVTKTGEVMSEKDVFGLRLNTIEKNYLYEIAQIYGLKKRGSDELSVSKAMRYMLTYCMDNKLKFDNKEQSEIGGVRKLIEEIHASIPHILFQIATQNACTSTSMTDEQYSQAKDNALSYINETVAGFQTNSYKYVKAKINRVGIKTIPLESGVSLWK